ncbi:MAG TPA: helix-hairpin-helix domain-containing protein [Thermoplasmata archaeon]|nr:helix-hairpin-helix domain-containing protein [Thermoplasmata archaeon]
MPSNAEAAETFRTIADLLDVLGERFKPEAYRRAARSIDSLTEDLAAVSARGELRTVPGVGEAIEEKIREYLTTGRIDYLERLRREVPPGVAELLRIPGIGPKSARRFWTELGIEGPAELLAAIDARRLEGVQGFGPKKIAQVRRAVEAARGSGPVARLPIEVAYPVAQRIVQSLRERAGAEQVVIAGSFRRGRETVGDLDILVTSHDPTRAFDVFSALPEVREVRLRGGTKETVVLTNGLQVDVRVVEPASFGAALQYFTGSKDHNVVVRTLAKDAGLRVNEYGVFRGEERVAGTTEEEVYGALGLAWIPPELREGRGEVEAARKGPLPPLVEERDLRGDLHVHLPPGAGSAELDRLLGEARRRGYAYVGVVSEGVSEEGKPFRLPDPLVVQAGKASTPRFRVFRVAEVDGPPAEGESAPVGVDLVVRRPTGRRPGPPEGGEDPRPPALVAHLGGGGTDAVPTVRVWIAYAAAVGAAVEVGPGSERLDSTWARTAREQGVRLAVPTGLLSAEEDPTRPVALAFARRAGATVADVVNAGLAGPTRAK